MDWRVKAVAQGILSRVPRGGWVNQRLQDSRDANPADKIRKRLVRAAQEIAWAEAQGVKFESARIVEIGTGRTPVPTVLMALLGADAIYSFDRTRLLDERRLLLIARQLPDLVDELAPILNREPPDLATTAKWLSGQTSVAALLREARIVYRAPADVASSDLPSGSIDSFVSFDVLEHVPPAGFGVICAEVSRLLSASGRQFHAIGIGDHFADLDGNITKANFLQFSDSVWHLISGHSLAYHNRLRPSDFERIFQAHGFVVISMASQIDEPSLGWLAHSNVSSRFCGYSQSELATHRAMLVLGRGR